jgi:hypothetical protein
VQTLERYLIDQRSVSSASRALYIHRNTLRQRLARIEKLSGLDLATGLTDARAGDQGRAPSGGRAGRLSPGAPVTPRIW